MLLPMKWLNKYIELDNPDVSDYARRMIMAGNAVEAVHDLGAEVDKVVVGHILKIEPHPDSDHLSICQVDVGEDEPLQIVTGAANMSEGDFVPVALDGSQLPGGVKIKKGKLRGVESNGMMCSGEELGVPQDVYPSNAERGLLILNGTFTPGEDIKPILGLDEKVVDFEILANRPDCLSILGLAYESAAAAGGKMKGFDVSLAPTKGDIHEHVRIDVEDSELCPRYCARVVKNIKIEPSPLWMRMYLHAAGVRPINNIVDITNFVMLEMGQPMHAFDLDSVAGRHIIVRRAGDTKKIRTLDGKDRDLKPEMLVIADESGATGLAGVMGGEGSEITENTKLVLFESACFDGASIRQTGRALGLRTEAQGRFEHGVNVRLVRKALDRAAQLVQELGAGEVVNGVIDIYPDPKPVQEVRAAIPYVQTLMGIKVEPETMVQLLEKLSIQTRIEGDEIVCIPPEFRQDIVRGADIAEEVLRLYGYDKIPESKLRGAADGRRSKALERNGILRQLLLGFGLYETVTYSFISPKWMDLLLLDENAPERKAARIINPIGEDYSIMRTTLVPSLLTTLATNYNRSCPSFGCFENGVRFLPESVPITEQPEERPDLCFGLYGEGVDFYTIKGMVETIFDRFALKDVRFVRSDKAYLHPGRSAQAMVGDTCVAILGQVHPDVAEHFALGGCETYVAEIDLKALDALCGGVGEIKSPARFPAVQRDLAFVMDEKVPVGDLMDEMRRSAGKLCREVRLFDIYRGIPIPAGKKSVAISVLLQAEDRTLTDEQINSIVDKCLKVAETSFGAVLRT